MMKETMTDPVARKQMRKYFPQAYNVFGRMMKEIG